MIKLSIIRDVATKEFKNSLRNRWVLVVSVITALLALAISYFGAAPTGRTGFGSFEVTIVSLSSLVTYLVPIIALTLGFDAIVGEKEGKTLELLLTMPLSRFELFTGKFAGLGLALAVSTAAGFGLAGALIGWMVGTAHLGAYLLFIATAVLLGLSFLAISLTVSVGVGERAKAVGWVIFIWFFYILIFDLILIGVLVATEGRLNPTLFPLLLYLNPADLFRLINLTSAEGVKAAYGLSALAKGDLFNLWLLLGALVGWIVAPLGLGYAVFRKRGY